MQCIVLKTHPCYFVYSFESGRQKKKQAVTREGYRVKERGVGKGGEGRFPFLFLSRIYFFLSYLASLVVAYTLTKSKAKRTNYTLLCQSLFGRKRRKNKKAGEKEKKRVRASHRRLPEANRHLQLKAKPTKWFFPCDTQRRKKASAHSISLQNRKTPYCIKV